MLQWLSALKQFAGRSEGPIIAAGNGDFIDPDYFDGHIFGPIRERAKVPHVRFHDLRHSFASMLIHQGESPKYVSDQLGHSSLQITFDTYGHLFPQARAEASARLEKQMFDGLKRLIVRRMLEDGESGDGEEGRSGRVN